MTRYRNIAILCFAIVAALCCWVIVAEAATTTVTLAWDANTEPDLAGYRLYESPAAGGPYTAIQTLGLVTTTAVPGLPDGLRCWVLTARDTIGNESGYSNEVCSTSDATAPAAPQSVRVTVTVRVE
jgi:hypothetical protein